MFWGRSKENGIWLAKARQIKFLTGGDRLFYVAIWRFRVRLMNPFRPA